MGKILAAQSTRESEMALRMYIMDSRHCGDRTVSKDSIKE